MVDNNSNQSTLRDLIQEGADANNVPPELLLELYELEQELITKEHRSEIGKQVRKIVEKHAPKEEEA